MRNRKLSGPGVAVGSGVGVGTEVGVAVGSGVGVGTGVGVAVGSGVGVGRGVGVAVGSGVGVGVTVGSGTGVPVGTGALMAVGSTLPANAVARPEATAVSIAPDWSVEEGLVAQPTAIAMSSRGTSVTVQGFDLGMLIFTLNTLVSKRSCRKNPQAT